MTITQIKKKFRVHADDYDPENINYTIVTEGKWFNKKDVPKNYRLERIGSVGPVDKPKLHRYFQELIPI